MAPHLGLSEGLIAHGRDRQRSKRVTVRSDRPRFIDSPSTAGNLSAQGIFLAESPSLGAGGKGSEGGGGGRSMLPVVGSDVCG